MLWTLTNIISGRPDQSALLVLRARSNSDADSVAVRFHPHPPPAHRAVVLLLEINDATHGPPLVFDADPIVAADGAQVGYIVQAVHAKDGPVASRHTGITGSGMVTTILVLAAVGSNLATTAINLTYEFSRVVRHG